MSELATTAAILRAVAEIAESGEFASKRMDIRRQELIRPGEGLYDPEVSTQVFTGLTHTRGAGAAAYLTAKMRDKGKVTWTVEVWIDTWQAPGEEGEGSWKATVKGEVEIDDGVGDPRSKFDLQRNADDIQGTVSALRECARKAASHQIHWR